MANETWRYVSSALLRALNANAPRVASEEPRVLNDMLEHFGCWSFFRRNAQGFPSFSLLKAYDKEECAFAKTARIIPLYELPIEASVISSPVMYKIKQEEQSLRLKAQIAPHGNEDSTRNDLRSDCLMCTLHGVRVLLPITVLREWTLTKLDVESAFLQTGAAARDVYVIPPLEVLLVENLFGRY